MASVDLHELQQWYRTAVAERATELEALRPRTGAGGDAAARDAVRAVGHALRGSGGSFGFPSVSEVGKLLESADDDQLLRRVDGTVALLRALEATGREGAQGPPTWLLRVAGIPGREIPDLPDRVADAWPMVADAVGIGSDLLARKVANHYRLTVLGPGDQPAPVARRLVPEGLVRAHGAVPIREDGVSIDVAVSDPTDVVLEGALRRLTGRSTRFLVAPPERLAPFLSDATPSAPPPPPPPEARTRAPGAAPRILLADDDTGYRLMARATLERKGMVVVEASDGAGALERFDEAEGFDLVVVDLEMPGTGGREIVRALRAPPRSSPVPVIVVTGAEDPVLEADLIEDGADDYIRKPLDPRLFLARVQATLRRSAS